MDRRLKQFIHFVIGAVSSSIALLAFHWAGIGIPSDSMVIYSFMLFVLLNLFDLKYPLNTLGLGFIANILVTGTFMETTYLATVHIATAIFWGLLLVPVSISLSIDKEHKVTSDTSKNY
jgi:hypothetical protein